MFEKRTVFILGAGASKDVGMPTGPELAKIIGEKTLIDRDLEDGFGDPKLFHGLERALSTNGNNIARAFQIINRGIVLSSSIDDFLDLHRDDEIVVGVGKAAIAKAIREREAESALMVKSGQGIDMSAISTTWYVKLMQMLSRGIGRGDVHHLARNVSFVSFNYDRCIEHFLLHAVAQLYAISANEAVKVCRLFRFHHPYGSLGSLPELADGGGRAVSEFGYLGSDLNAAAANILTYTEQVGSAEQAAIAEEIGAANQLVFLGFGFHRQNIEILKPIAELQAVSAYGTAFGISTADKTVVVNRVLSLYSPGFRAHVREGVAFSNSTCGDFMSEYQLTLPS